MRATSVNHARAPEESLGSGTSPGTGALGVITLRPDDPDAPGGCSALAVGKGVLRLRRAVDLLAPMVRRLLIAAPVEAEAGIRAQVPDLAGVGILLVNASGVVDQVAAALAVLAPGSGDLVVVHDPVVTLIPDLLGEVMTPAGGVGGEDGAELVVPVLPVTDTLKRVDGTGTIRSTVDRDTHRRLSSPQVFRAEALLTAVEAVQNHLPRGAEATAEDLLRAVRRAGGRIRMVEAPLGSPG